MISRIVFVLLGAICLVLIPQGKCMKDVHVVNSESITSRSELKMNPAGVCPFIISSFKGNVFCSPNFTLVFIGHCYGYINQTFSGIHHEGYVTTRCPYFAGTETTSLFVRIKKTVPHNLTSNEFCKMVKSSHRAGLLCRDCKKDFGISVLSPNFQCQNCSKFESQVVNYMKLFGITVIPLTLLFLIITIFHISLTSAPTNAYIFFCHVITLKVNVLIIESAWANTLQDKDRSKQLSQFLLFPLYIWNLDFAYYLKTEVACLGKDLKIMHIIFMYYIYATYPMLLILVTFVLVKLHDRNFKPVVYLWKPFYCVFVRLRRNWNVRTSLIDAFASCILLSYSKVIDISLALINPNPVYDRNGATLYTTLHYDINTQFLSKEHLPFFIIAIIVLSTFGLLPPLLLTFYPFRWFQKVLNKLHLSRIQSLYIFLDAFQGCYKNGTAGSPERRYFAGFYFVFRIIIVFVTSFGYTTIPESTTILIAVNASFLCIIAVFQPYKNGFYNFLDALIFLILTATNSNILYSFGYSQIHGELPNAIWPITYTFLLLPTVYMIIYIFYWILTRFRARCCIMRGLRRRFFTGNDYGYERITEETRTSHESSLTSIENLSDSFPDRLNNPYRYETQSRGIFREQNNSVTSERRIKGIGSELAHYGALTY